MTITYELLFLPLCIFSVEQFLFLVWKEQEKRGKKEKSTKVVSQKNGWHDFVQTCSLVGLHLPTKFSIVQIKNHGIMNAWILELFSVLIFSSKSFCHSPLIFSNEVFSFLLKLSKKKCCHLCYFSTCLHSQKYLSAYQ